MGSKVILLCIALSAVQAVHAQIWEFGVDNLPTAIVVSVFKGSFTLFQKEQKIQLIVPPCHILTYVNVEVNNFFSTPEVHYNTQTHVVTITYSLLQLSPSRFTIIAKGVVQNGCNVQRQQQLPPAQQAPPQGRQGPRPIQHGSYRQY
ncbi:uncharacterized protein LOC118263631 [Spodoptera frugiperda]|uniref:Uncharacterized protein LOC118263631 n=1 Tax=Spodoptera frugiperda TaxID=7108 RepID=A0A9R0EGD3_SPOFR|nr:uncharacterized protein LOC118263631 [Spodoptera frugiperda]